MNEPEDSSTAGYSKAGVASGEQSSWMPIQAMGSLVSRHESDEEWAGIPGSVGQEASSRSAHSSSESTGVPVATEESLEEEFLKLVKGNPNFKNVTLELFSVVKPVSDTDVYFDTTTPAGVTFKGAVLLLKKRYEARESKLDAPLTVMNDKRAARWREMRVHMHHSTFAAQTIDATKQGPISEVSNAFQLYAEVGTAIVTDATCQLAVVRVCSELRTFYFDDWCSQVNARDTFEARPFFAIAAPSGSGKTQLGFDLQYADDLLQVVHVVLSESGEDPQEIYRLPSIDTSSQALIEAINLDLQVAEYSENNNNMLNVSATTLLNESASHQEFAIVEFLSCAFKLKLPNGAIAKTIREFRAALWRRILEVVQRQSVNQAYDQALPILVLDECWCAGNTASTVKLQYLRTVLRACGIAAVYMSTTMNVVNMVNLTPTDSNSRGSGRTKPWAKVICSLPPPTLLPQQSKLLLAHPSSAGARAGSPITSSPLHRILRNLARSGEPSWNPLMFHLLWTALLNGWTVSEASIDLYKRKHQLRTQDGVRGQVQYFLGNELSASHGVFVTSHFAKYDKDYSLFLEPVAEGFALKAAELIGLRVSESGYESESNKLRRLSSQGDTMSSGSSALPYFDAPFPHFATCKADPLLPLLLGGCCSAQGGEPFALGRTPLTAAAAYLLSKRRESSSKARTGTNSTSASVQVRIGDNLECIGSLAAVCASQGAGVLGGSVLQYLLAFVRELQPVVLAELEYATTTQEQIMALWSQSNMIIPYICRVGDEYPSSIHTGIATLLRPKNQEEVDNIVYLQESTPGALESRQKKRRAENDWTHRTKIFVNEYKNYEKPLTGYDIEKIVEKIECHNVSLGFIVISKLAKVESPVDTASTNVVELKIIDRKVEIVRVGYEHATGIPHKQLSFQAGESAGVGSKVLVTRPSGGVFPGEITKITNTGFSVRYDPPPITKKPKLICVVVCDEMIIAQYLKDHLRVVWNAFARL